MTINVLITGSNGFLGSALSNYLSKRNEFKVFTLSRHKSYVSNNHFCIDQLSCNTNWDTFLSEINVVIHCASVTSNNSNSEKTMFSVNVESSLSLAKACVSSGVSRFIFISSIGVCGYSSSTPLSETSKCFPYNKYTRSKYLFEILLNNICSNSAMDFVIIRLPMVYGPDAKGNFKKLLSLVKTKLPLPFSSINNIRDYVALDNVLDFISLCSRYDLSIYASNHTFHLTDSNPISLHHFLIKIYAAFSIKKNLFSFPYIYYIFILFGKRSLADRLFNELLIDSSKARTLLGWTPVITIDEQLKKIAQLNDSSL